PGTSGAGRDGRRRIHPAVGWAHSRRPGAGARGRGPGHQLRPGSSPGPGAAPVAAGGGPDHDLAACIRRGGYPPDRTDPVRLPPGGEHPHLDPSLTDSRAGSGHLWSGLAVPRAPPARGNPLGLPGGCPLLLLTAYFGVWRSLAARFVRDEEAVGSNPATPTNRDRWSRPLRGGVFGFLGPGPPTRRQREGTNGTPTRVGPLAGRVGYGSASLASARGLRYSADAGRGDLPSDRRSRGCTRLPRSGLRPPWLP